MITAILQIKTSIEALADECAQLYGHGNGNASQIEGFLFYVNTPLKDGYTRCLIDDDFGLALEYLQENGGSDNADLVRVEWEGQTAYDTGTGLLGYIAGYAEGEPVPPRILEVDLTPEMLEQIHSCYAKWEPGKAVAAGEVYSHSLTLYRVVQPHTTQSDWTPDVVPALFVKTVSAGVIPDWVQPAGAHDAYQTGDRVRFEGSIYESTIDANVWAPNAYGWSLVE